MILLRCISKAGYFGYDPDTGSDVRASYGSIVEVSEKKGEQMLEDFPEEFVRAEEPARKPDVKDFEEARVWQELGEDLEPEGPPAIRKRKPSRKE